MPFCANCGTAVEGQFCAKCGSAVAGPAAAAASNAMADNVAAALCYVLGLITGIIFLLIAPYNQNKTIRFHAFQSIFLHVACIAVIIVGNIVLGMMHLWMFEPLLGLAFFILWIFMIVKAWQGDKIVLPVVGQFAQLQA